MIAVVLAAGMGTRLRPLTDHRPKALVEIAGRSLLARLIEACAEAGMREAVVVTGYRRNDIDVLRDSFALPVTTVFNDKYDVLGNAWSLYVAKRAIAGRSFVKLDGDILLDPTILSDVMAHPSANALVLDDAAQIDAEAMKATLVDERVTALGKWIAPADAAGESIGVEKIGEPDAVFEAIEQMVADGGGDGYYEDAYHRMLKRDWQLGVTRTAGRLWTEIDDMDDLARAERLLG
jgi:choline kinase